MDFPTPAKGHRKTEVRMLVPQGSENRQALLAAEMVVEQEARRGPMRLVKVSASSPEARAAFGVGEEGAAVVVIGAGGTRTLTGKSITSAAVRKAIREVGADDGAD